MKMLSSKKIFFVKRQKIEIVPQFHFFINVWAMPCVTIQEDLLLLDWCFTRRKKYAVLCGVLYSIHPTSITVLRSICFMLKQFCNIDMTYSTKIFHVPFFKTPPIWHMQFTALSSQTQRAWQRAEADGKVAEVEGWLGRKGWQHWSLKMCCFSVTWRRPCHSTFFCLITRLSLRYAAGWQGCWRDCDTDRKRKRRNNVVCSEQSI